jgi:hypothetical protein
LKLDEILWLEKPKFELVDDDELYVFFVCTKRGLALLGDSTRVEFELGWRTDVTSTPSFLSPIVPKLGPHAPAALLHDRLLDLGFPRAYARKWMRNQLKALRKVEKWRKWAMHAGVWVYDLFKRAPGRKISRYEATTVRSGV